MLAHHPLDGCQIGLKVKYIYIYISFEVFSFVRFLTLFSLSFEFKQFYKKIKILKLAWPQVAGLNAGIAGRRPPSGR